MIRVTHKIRYLSKGGQKSAASHEVIVTITGARDLGRLADSIHNEGDWTMASAVREARRFTMRMTPERWDQLNGRLKK